MKDEIKLKDMTDFLENIYKDIKIQPTLEEELEKERKFINKIKGDNEDEIKEILEQCDSVIKREIPLLILAPEYTQILIDYITNLQEENEYSDYCNKKLREKITNLEYKITTLEDYKTINEKAIEYIENNKQLSMFADLRKEGTHQYTLECDADDLLEILQGKSDE